ncbi:MAG: type I restriction endonuclease subunit R [Mycoplasma sp.]
MKTILKEYKKINQSNENYESENLLELSFLQQLIDQGYENVNVKNDTQLILNLKTQLEKLNNMTFSNNEWKQIEKVLINNDSITQKTNFFQNNVNFNIELDDGSKKNIYFINKKDYSKNTFQIFNQFEDNNSTYKARYDVTILINGIPLIHLELKRRGVDIKQAFNQINRYHNQNFAAGSGLFNYIQLFIISNGTYTKYYSNTIRDSKIKTHNRKLNDFKFTSFWTDIKNNKINDIVDFTNTFLQKETCFNIITKYCVFTVNNTLKVLRPYQIAAIEAANETIINNMVKGQFQSKQGGYIFHTTGSGKTLTSFKLAKLCIENPNIEKVLFVVDRKDLDSQTIKEYSNFQNDSVLTNATTKKIFSNLTEKSSTNNDKILVTTIHKLDKIAKLATKPFSKSTVLIFDECHRTQFGEMSRNIQKHFSNGMMIGFTGTPIFAENMNKSNNNIHTTTEHVFGKQLHKYSIIEAINDGSVLPFRYMEYSTLKNNLKENSLVRAINETEVMRDERRINGIVDNILKNYATQTYRRSILDRETGFNGILAVDSIESLKKYYTAFRNKNPNFRVATIFSYNKNENIKEDKISIKGIDKSSREFLDFVLIDYNHFFKTSYKTTDESFEDYYKNLSERVKNCEVDLLIVVNMFLTGFDSKRTNTIWIDKNLEYHGLIQTFSRVNRIYNSTKVFGNVISFRPLEEKLKAALLLFGGESALDSVLIKTFDEYMNGYENNSGNHQKGYLILGEQLKQQFNLNNFDNNILLEEDKKQFIKLFNSFQRVENTLKSFEEFTSDKMFFTEREIQNYISHLLRLKDHFENLHLSQKASIVEDVYVDVTLIQENDINIDYIQNLLSQESQKNEINKISFNNLKEMLRQKFNSSPTLRPKSRLLDAFLKKYTSMPKNFEEEFNRFGKEEEEKYINILISKFNLNSKKISILLEECKKNGFSRFNTKGPDELFENPNEIESWRITKKELGTELKNFFSFFGYNVN